MTDEQPQADDLSAEQLDALVDELFGAEPDPVAEIDEQLANTSTKLKNPVDDDDREGRDSKGRFAPGNRYTPRKRKDDDRDEVVEKLTLHGFIRRMVRKGRTRDRVDVFRLLERAIKEQLSKAAKGDRPALKLILDQLVTEARLELDQARPTDGGTQVLIVTGVPEPDPNAPRPKPPQPVPRLETKDGTAGPEDLAAIAKIAGASPAEPPPPGAREIILGGARYDVTRLREETEAKSWNDVMGVTAELDRRRNPKELPDATD